MSRKTLSVATLSGLFAVLVGLVVLAGCGGSNSTPTTTTGSPAVTLSGPLTFSSGVGVASAPQSETVTNSGTATLTFTSITITTGSTVFQAPSNTCGTSLGAGSACTISVVFTPTATGAASGTLSIADNASDSPQTVTLSGTATSVSVSTNTLQFSGVAVGTTSTPESVTVSNASASAVAISTPTISGDFAISSNSCGTSVAASANCAISVTFSPVGSGPWTGTLAFVVGGVNESVSLTGSTTVSNTVPVTVGLGFTGAYPDGIYTTVTVCEPAGTPCVTVNNVLVDTGSVGLRVLSSALTGVTLSQLNDGSGDYLNECTEYGDGSFNWGPVSLATVQIGGETASQVPLAAGGSANSGIPIQIISNDAVPAAVTESGQCTPASADEYTVTSLGANGILGVGNFPQDCGEYCTDTTPQAQDPYWICTTTGLCEQEAVSIATQVWNPVAAFSSSDTNGVLLSLPSIPAGGAVSDTGTLTFGIGTESNNAIANQTVYELDDYGNFNSATFDGVTFCTSGAATCPTNEASGGTFIDSGSSGFFVSDATTLGTSLCTTDTGYYCPSSTLNLSLGLTGTNGTSGTVSLPIANAQTLFSNTTFAAFDDLAAPSCIATSTTTCNTSTDSWDLGLPFFFGRPIFVGIAGATSGSPNLTNGYWAF
ncbi:MAG: DUF3443 family protein [Terriglobia bacterium]